MKGVFQVLLVAIVYYALGRIGQMAALPPNFITAIWPASGFALAILLIAGNRFWPGIFLGSWLNNILLFPEFNYYSLSASAIMGTGAVLQALFGAFLFKRYLPLDRPFQKPENIFRFVLVAAASCIVNSCIGPLGLIWGGVLHWSDYLANSWTWFVGDFSGVMLFTPLVLSWNTLKDIRWSYSRFLEYVLLILSALIIMTLVFYSEYQLMHLLIAIVLWTGFRFKMRGATLILVIMNAFAVYQTAIGKGPFVTDSLTESIILLESFILAITILTLLLVSFVAERNQNMRLLEAHSRYLQDTVDEQSIDIREKDSLVKSREEQIKLQDKNAFLGQLSKNIAIEIQNPLQYITELVKHSQILNQRIQRGVEGNLNGEARDSFLAQVDAVNKNLKKIDECEQRVQNIITDYLVENKDTEEEFQPVDLNLLLDSYLQFAYHDTHSFESWSDIHVKKDFDKKIGFIDAIPKDLIRVIFNILNNANQAVHTKKISKGKNYQPEIMISTHDLGNNVSLVIRDNGIGISDEDMKKIFTPFFSTKETSNGIGLGLSISQEIINTVHQGKISIESEPGKYTTVTIVIPKKQPVANLDLF